MNMQIDRYVGDAEVPPASGASAAPVRSPDTVPTDEAATREADRRAADRVRIAMAVKQQVEKRVFLCQASNLSPGGMFLARVFDEFYEQAPRCVLEFDIPLGQDNESMAVPAHIIRQARRGRYHLMGVHFSSLSATHRRMLAEFLQRVRSPQELQAFETAAWS